MLLDDTVPADEIVTVLRPRPPTPGPSGEESPILRFRVPEEDLSSTHMPRLPTTGAAAFVVYVGVSRLALRLPRATHIDMTGDIVFT